MPILHRTAKIAVRTAIARLTANGFVGESNRARVMSDQWRRRAVEMFGQADAKAIGAAPALRVVRQLSAAVRYCIIKSEVAARKSA